MLLPQVSNRYSPPTHRGYLVNELSWDQLSRSVVMEGSVETTTPSHQIPQIHKSLLDKIKRQLSLLYSCLEKRKK